MNKVEKHYSDYVFDIKNRKSIFDKADLLDFANSYYTSQLKEIPSDTKIKTIRETISFYCGGTPINVQLAAEVILSVHEEEILNEFVTWFNEKDKT